MRLKLHTVPWLNLNSIPWEGGSTRYYSNHSNRMHFCRRAQENYPGVQSNRIFSWKQIPGVRSRYAFGFARTLAEKFPSFLTYRAVVSHEKRRAVASVYDRTFLSTVWILILY